MWPNDAAKLLVVILLRHFNTWFQSLLSIITDCISSDTCTCTCIRACTMYVNQIANCAYTHSFLYNVLCYRKFDFSDS